MNFFNGVADNFIKIQAAADGHGCGFSVASHLLRHSICSWAILRFCHIANDKDIPGNLPHHIQSDIGGQKPVKDGAVLSKQRRFEPGQKTVSKQFLLKSVEIVIML
jgi:hypothetical protein